jgi:tetratricopeptide (TPR) repeat protein
MSWLSWLIQLFRNFWGRLTVQYGMGAAACALGIWVHYQYRLQGSMLFLLLPVVGVILLVYEFVLIVNQFATNLPRWDPFRSFLARTVWSAGLLVRLFVYSSLLLYANGTLDTTPPLYRAAEIDSEAWKKTVGLPNAYSWVTLRYRDDPDHPMRVLITEREKARLWGAQPVSVKIKQGMFDIPTVTAIEQDWGWYGAEILKRAPTATLVWQAKLVFELTHDRWTEGIEGGRRYLQLKPEDWKTANDIGALLFQGLRYQDSLPFFQHAVQQHPSYSTMQAYGAALNWAGQSSEAAVVLKESIHLDTDNWEAYYHLGYVYGDMGQFEEAIGFFEEVLKRQPYMLDARAMITKHREDIVQRDALARFRKSATQKSAQGQ